MSSVDIYQSHSDSIMEPPRKVARLQELRSAIPYVSQRALAAILREITHDDVDHSYRRQTLRDARDMQVAIATPYGSLHKSLLIEDANVNIEVQNPLAMMYHLAATSPSFSKLLARTASACPSEPGKPWKVLIYFDEVGYRKQIYTQPHTLSNDVASSTFVCDVCVCGKMMHREVSPEMPLLTKRRERHGCATGALLNLEHQHCHARTSMFQHAIVCPAGACTCIHTRSIFVYIIYTCFSMLCMFPMCYAHGHDGIQGDLANLPISNRSSTLHAHYIYTTRRTWLSKFVLFL